LSKPKELSTIKDSLRNYLHLEIDISGSNFTYQTGDHSAVWPRNANTEAERFPESVWAFGRSGTRAIQIEAVDDMS
jgi:sulfite reductase alpha subunit-like flavoprotein